jgi:hypothetical protein
MFTPQEATRIAIEKFKIVKETDFVNVMNEIARAANLGKFEVYFNSMYPETIERIKNDGWNLYQYPSGECKISWPKGIDD